MRLEPPPGLVWEGAPSDWMGLTLQRAAKLATERSGREWTADDFLEAAADGRIRIRAKLPQRPLRTRPCDEGVQPLPAAIPPGMEWHLPIAACCALQSGGRAVWRVFEGADRERPHGLVFYFDQWELEPDEPDIVTTLDDVRVPVFDVQALVESRNRPAIAAEQDSAPALPVERKWTPDRIREAFAMRQRLEHERDKAPMQRTAQHYGVSAQYLRRLFREAQESDPMRLPAWAPLPRDK